MLIDASLLGAVLQDRLDARVGRVRSMMVPHDIKQDRLICTMLGQGQDNGALTYMAERLLEPGVLQYAMDPAWRADASRYSEVLARCVEHAQNSQVQAKAGQLILSILRETFGSPEGEKRMSASFLQGGGGWGWLNLKPLMRGLKIASPSGTVALLSAAFSNPSVSVRARSWALITYSELGGSRPACTSDIVDQMLREQPDLGFSEDGRIQGLLDCGLMTPLEVASYLVRPEASNWFSEIGHVLRQRPDPALTEKLLHLLRCLFEQPLPNLSCLFAIINIVEYAPRDDQQTRVIRSGLELTLAKSDRYEHGEVRRVQILERLHVFGALSHEQIRRERFEASGHAKYLDSERAKPYLISGFAKSTLVHTPDGMVRIDALKSGDVVLSREQEGAAVIQQRVLRVQRNEDIRLHKLTYLLSDPDSADLHKGGVLFVSEHHPFWQQQLGWNAVSQFGRGEGECYVGAMNGEPLRFWGLSKLYRTDQAGLAWVSPTRSRNTDLKGTLWDIEQVRPQPESCQYNWRDWDPEGDVEDDDAQVLFVTDTWDIEVEGAHSYFVGKHGLWVYDASVEGGFRREYAASMVARDAFFDEIE